MELGYDAVLLNSAVSQAKNPVDMAIAFSQAICAGRNGFRSGLITPQSLATPTTDISNNIF
jgi:thiazole synthase